MATKVGPFINAEEGPAGTWGTTTPVKVASKGLDGKLSTEYFYNEAQHGQSAPHPPGSARARLLHLLGRPAHGSLRKKKNRDKRDLEFFSRAVSHAVAQSPPHPRWRANQQD